MTSYGYTLSSEEHAPNDLVRHAARAEEVGFEFASISDHYHPWIDNQGHSPFVWAVLGGIAHATERIKVGTGVTCPIMRIHPAVIAQAAATAADMLPGRFYLGVGTGENLNEHIVGEGWPSVTVRQEMLDEAVELIRHLWDGKLTEFYGEYFSVQDARIYTLPEQLPPIYVAASGSESAKLAGEIGDGFISTAPKSDLVQTFEEAGGRGKPKYAQAHVCYHEDEAEARRIAHKIWPNSGIPGELSAELPLPRHFEQASQNVTEDAIAEMITCGPDPEKHVAQLRKFEEAGFDHVYVHQVGPVQEGFLRFYEREVLPQLRGKRAAA